MCSSDLLPFSNSQIREMHHEDFKVLANLLIGFFMVPELNSSGEEASECSETQEPSPPSSVDSSEKTPEEKMQSEAETWEHFSQAQPTFLGTTVWEKRIPFDGQDFKVKNVSLQ